MKKILSIFITILILLVLSNACFSGGYAIYEHGAGAMGMAGCYVALANSPAAIYFNPGGLTKLSRTNLYMGTTLIFPSTTFEGPFPLTDKNEMKSNVYYPSNIYVSRALNEKLSIGFGFFSPFGLGTEWKEDWVGRFHAVKTDLQTFFFNPSVAYKIHPKVSIGAGISYVYSKVILKRAINTQDAAALGNPIAAFLPYDYFKGKDGMIDLQGSGTGFCFNFGALFDVTDKISFGISYRSSAKIDCDGDAKFALPSTLMVPDESGKPTDIIPALQLVLKDQKAKTQITMPQTIIAGVAVKVLPQLTALVDINYVGWSSFDKLALEFKDSESLNEEIEEDYENAMIYRIGLDYVLNENVSLRAGYIYDASPCPEKSVSPLLPDANRNEIALGIGYTINKITIDAAFLYIKFDDRRNNIDGKLNGMYSNTAKLFGINFGYFFE